MAILVRRITRGEWDNGISDSKDLPFRAITDDLHSKDNTLSTWRINNLDEIDDILVAIALQGQFIGTVNAVYFDEEILKELGIEIIESEGRTGHKGSRSSHRDLVGLRYRHMNDVVDLIINSIRDKRTSRMTGTQLQKRISECMKEDQIELESLSKELQIEVLKACLKYQNKAC